MYILPFRPLLLNDSDPLPLSKVICVNIKEGDLIQVTSSALAKHDNLVHIETLFLCALVKTRK